MWVEDLAKDETDPVAVLVEESVLTRPQIDQLCATGPLTPMK